MTDTVRGDGVFSRLYLNDEKFAVTIEHAFEGVDMQFAPKLPRPGWYRCVRGMHQLEHGPRFETFEITGVPGHRGILFHVGNFNRNSDGCVLLGERLHTESEMWWIDNSLNTFTRFMAANADVDEFDLEVS